MKICNRCNLSKELIEFPKHTMTLDGRAGHCVQCEKKRRLSVRYEVTITERKCNHCQEVKSAENFAKNPRYIGGLNTWCKKCSNLIRSEKNYHIQSNLNKKERINNDPDYRKKILEQKRVNSRINFKTTMISNAKRRALEKNLEFTITAEDLNIPEFCPILKILFTLGTKGDYEYTPSIDRINNNLGYTKENIQIITKKANSMKNSGTPEELLLLAEWILKTFK